MELSGAFIRGVCKELGKITERGDMPRQLTSHIASGLDEQLAITVLDEPGSGGACHLYSIRTDEPRPEGESPAVRTDIAFQTGPIGENGVNGISNESLLAIVEDRLAGFQSGPFACIDNGLALSHVQMAMKALHQRTKERVARGVEGTLQR